MRNAADLTKTLEATLARDGSGTIIRADTAATNDAFRHGPDTAVSLMRHDVAMAHQHTTTAADGTTIAWSTVGTGDPVLLVHGITESAASFDPVTTRLASTNQVITLDLRGHGESGTADSYDLAAMASDVAAVAAAAGVDAPHLVGHSLGGAVVTAAGAAMPTRSIVDIDQSLQLGAFKDALVGVEPMLRDPDQFGLVIEGLFASMSGELLTPAEVERVGALRRADHAVVLGVWEMLLTESADDIDAVVDAVLAPYATSSTPYLALFGIDPGDEYADWLAGKIPGAVTEVWADHGHYPHLVDPDRFVARLHALWS